MITIETEPVPRVPVDQRVVVDDLGYQDDGITHVTARFGYMETPNVPGSPGSARRGRHRGQVAARPGVLLPVQDRAGRGDQPTMAGWRKRLLIATSYITADAAEFFGLPRNRTVIMGSHIEV